MIVQAVIIFRFCGPGTKLSKRLGQTGVNPLDTACKYHDIAYANSSSLADRHVADKQLADTAWSRVKAKDSRFGERVAALAVTGIMKAKRKLGMGRRRRRGSKKRKGRGAATKILSFLKILRLVRAALKKAKSKTLGGALKIAKRVVRGRKNKNIKYPRVIPIRKKGGFLPFLVPIFAALSALGALSGGAASIASTINKAKNAKETLDELKRHNAKMEAGSSSSVPIGHGLYLSKHKTGYGLSKN